MRISNMISTRNFINSSHAKNRDGYHNARDHSKHPKCIIKIGTTKMGFNFSSRGYWIWSISSLVRLMCFQQRFVSVLTAFIGFWYTYICFNPYYRTVVVASIQMLLAQQILGLAYFRYYYYIYIYRYIYSHLLSTIKIYNPEETCWYVRPANVIINRNTGLKCWPCRNRTPSCHYQANFTEYADLATIWCFAID